MVFGDSILNHDITIQNNWVRSPIGNGSDNELDVIKFGDAYNVTIEGNYLESQAVSYSGNGHQDIIQNYTKGGSNPGSPYNWVLRYNYPVMNDHTGGSGDNSFLMLQGMSGSPALACYSNVFLVASTADTGNNGIVVSRNEPGGIYYFHNNTVIRHSSAGNNTIRFEDTGTLYAENNVCMADPGVGGTGVSWRMARGVWDYNFFYGFPAADSNDAGPNGLINIDPLFGDFFGDDFSLRPASALIGRGNKIGSLYAFGIAPGATWPNPTLAPRSSGTWDIGAYQSGTPTP